jgi:hypothetical protein
MQVFLVFAHEVRYEKLLESGSVFLDELCCG